MGFLRKIHLFFILIYIVDCYNIVCRATVYVWDELRDKFLAIRIRLIAGLDRNNNYKRCGGVYYVREL